MNKLNYQLFYLIIAIVFLVIFATTSFLIVNQLENISVQVSNIPYGFYGIESKLEDITGAIDNIYYHR